ncbi:MAG: carboxylesterase family protein [Solirubrobacterales bacterium]|nr:carboxylesterase family protein [Solirubrobacterales bacterium]
MAMRRSKFGVLGLAAAIALLALGVSVIASSRGSARAATPDPVACSPNTDIQTTYGPICGTSANGVREWFGIPYAAPPVGSLRWQPPQAPTPWTTTRAATSFASECIQGIAASPAGSEDCLYVNVWRPADSSTNLPVLVHIHGGGFFNGSGNGDNSLLATRGHQVIVSMNYRLNIFGFLADRALGPNSGDYGLQDQQAALRWVQSNIVAFGGNPGNVTIYGESAGGSSVCDQIASPTAKGLFERGISVSGEYNTLLGTQEQAPRTPEDLESQDCKSALPTQAQANAAGSNFAAAVGCGPGTANVLACLQALPPSVIENAAWTPGSGYQYGAQGTVAPTINGTTLTLSLRQALKAGKVNRVRVIAGTDRDEDLVGTATSAAQYQSLIDAQYGSYASEVLARYPLSRFDSPGVAWRTVAADSDTVCPALQTDRDLASRMPTFGYEIDDNDIPPYAAAGAAVIAPGASHVGAWFLTPTASPLDANQQVLQDQELAFVTAFSRTGNPNSNGLLAVWPRFDPSNHPSEMSLQPAGDSEVVTAAQVAAQHNCAFWDKLAPNP